MTRLPLIFLSIIYLFTTSCASTGKRSYHHINVLSSVEDASYCKVLEPRKNLSTHSRRHSKNYHPGFFSFHYFLGGRSNSFEESLIAFLVILGIVSFATSVSSDVSPVEKAQFHAWKKGGDSILIEEKSEYEIFYSILDCESQSEAGLE